MISSPLTFFKITSVFFIYHLISFLNHNKKLKCKTCNDEFKLKEKQLAYFTSCKVSMTMFVFSCFFNILFIYNNFDIQLYKNSILLGNFTHLINLIILYFISYLFFDVTIGSIYYKNNIDILSGYIHHIVYFFISIYAIYTNNQAIYLLFFIEEFPTFVLGLGSYNKRYRHNNLFGFSFLFFRIIYHIILTYTIVIGNDKTILPFSIMALCLHVYWWKNWITKYYKLSFHKKIVKEKKCDKIN